MKAILTLTAILSVSSVALAEETTGQKMEKAGHEAKRKAKKGLHRAEEAAACAKGDAKCVETKMKNRAEEAGDYMKDKANESTDKH